MELRRREEPVQGRPVRDAVEHLAQDVRPARPQERLPEAEDGVLRALHVDLHHDAGRLGDQGGDGVEGSEADLPPAVEAHLRRVERGERRATLSRRDPDRLLRIADALPVDRDAVRELVPPHVRLEGIRDRGNDLERVDVDLRGVRRHGQGEQAGVRAHVEERVRLASEDRHGVEREPIVGRSAGGRDPRRAPSRSRIAPDRASRTWRRPRDPSPRSGVTGAGSRPERSDGTSRAPSRTIAFGTRSARKRLTKRFRPNQL